MVKKMPDWAIRAIKTFVQAFGGILVPEIVMILRGTIPVDWEGWKMVLIPLLCSALAAGISAVWNVVLEHLNETKENKDDE